MLTPKCNFFKNKMFFQLKFLFKKYIFPQIKGLKREINEKNIKIKNKTKIVLKIHITA